MDASTRKLRLLLVMVIGAVFGFVCKNAHTSENNDLIKKIKSAQSFEDIFGNGEKIELKTQPDRYILSAREVKISPDQRIYIVDFKSHCVHVFDSAGMWIRTFGSQGPGPEEFRNPNSIAIGKDGRIYVSDLGNNRIAVWDTSGHLSKTISLQGASHTIELTNENRIIVLSMGKNLFDIYDTDGTYLSGFGDWWDLATNYYPKYRIPIRGGSFTMDKDNTIYFVHVSKYEVRKYDMSGKLIKQFGRRVAFYREPPEPPITTDFESVRKWTNSWTPVDKVIALHEDVIAVQIRTPRHDSEYAKYTGKLEFYDREGNFLKGDFSIGMFLLTQDQKGMVYFLLNQESEDGLDIKNPALVKYNINKK